MARGDRVLILVDAGGPQAREFEVTATKAGYTIEVKHRGGMIEVSECKQNGEALRTDRFLAARVVALTEHRAEAPLPVLVTRLPGMES